MAETVDKRTFLAGMQCPTQGWYAHHARSAPPPPSPGLSWRLYVGAEIGRYARLWLGDGLLLPAAPADVALSATRAALDDPAVRLLYEASFQSGRLVARADALRRDGDGWQLIEVKSGLTPSDGDEPKPDYIDDIAYTLAIARQTGLSVTRASLVLINRDYRLDGARPLLAELDVTALVASRVSAFTADATTLADAIAAQTRPEPRFTFVCRDCDFFATDCVGAGVPDPIFVLPGLRKKKFDALHPCTRIAELPPDADLTDNQQRVADAVRTGTPHHDAAALSLLDRIIWPAAYLGFEAVSPAVPWFAERPPYDATPFQYSLHICDRPGAITVHLGYLAPSATDWRRALADQLLADLGTTGSIIVYSSYEKTRLSALAAVFPDLAAPIAAVIARLFDLERVVKDGYCHPEFGGRTSIKKVLPVVVPSLRYDTLDVRDGDDAMALFALMHVGQTPGHERPAVRDALLAYCHLDTLALVRLHEALCRIRETCR